MYNPTQKWRRVGRAPEDVRRRCGAPGGWLPGRRGVGRGDRGRLRVPSLRGTAQRRPDRGAGEPRRLAARAGVQPELCQWRVVELSPPAAAAVAVGERRKRTP